MPEAYPLSCESRSNAEGGDSTWGVGVGMSGNRNFVATIAARYGPRLRRFLAVRLRNVDDVPDLAQEVFLRLLRVEGYEGIRSPEAYLFTIASHVVHQHAVRRSSEPVSVDITEVFPELRTSASDDPPDQAVHAQQIDELERILAYLPVRVATALVLHRIAGYSVQEVGDELGVSRETAKKYLARAVEHCRTVRAGESIKGL
jgi:RNA polymerase sigma factor (sigma-70 family)